MRGEAAIPTSIRPLVKGITKCNSFRASGGLQLFFLLVVPQDSFPAWTLCIPLRGLCWRSAGPSEDPQYLALTARTNSQALRAPWIRSLNPSSRLDQNSDSGPCSGERVCIPGFTGFESNTVDGPSFPLAQGGQGRGARVGFIS